MNAPLSGQRIHITGVVQGVGFRPFVYNLALRHGLCGEVCNTSAGVEIAVEGDPGKIIDIYQSGSLRMGRVDYGGIVKEACLAYVPEAQVGDYTVIHVGFAISLLDEEEAQATLDTIRQIADLETELGPPSHAIPVPGAGP
ncbi:MAG: HypC/HybG/HupF family hydrogenase formation chaperone [Chloroflexi bacterium]|nr:HypC/HybG/HupF family hydrogenase formation chaperone [Chloroflexota bacterium]